MSPVQDCSTHIPHILASCYEMGRSCGESFIFIYVNNQTTEVSESCSLKQSTYIIAKMILSANTSSSQTCLMHVCMSAPKNNYVSDHLETAFYVFKSKIFCFWHSLVIMLWAIRNLNIKISTRHCFFQSLILIPQCVSLHLTLTVKLYFLKHGDTVKVV